MNTPINKWGGGGGGGDITKIDLAIENWRVIYFFKEQNMIIGLKNVGFLFVSFLESNPVQNK